MKTRNLLFVAVLGILTACNQNEPKENVLLGTWSEPYHVKAMVKSITFKADGTAQYKYVPDTTWDVIIDWAGECVDFNYSVIDDNKLYCTNVHTSPKTVSKDYVTSFQIQNDTLTIDSLSAGEFGWVKSLKLGKQ